MITPEFTPGNFIEERVFSPDPKPEAIIYGDTVTMLKGVVSQEILEDDFCANDLTASMSDAVESQMETLAIPGIRTEKAWGRTHVLHIAYGMEPPEKPYNYDNPDKAWRGPLLAPLSEEFGQDLLAQVEDLDMDFSPLQEMHSVFKSTELLSLFRGLNALPLEGCDSALMATDQVFNQVKGMLFSPDYTLPLDDPGSIYLLCFLPYRTRQVVKEAMIANQMVQQMYHLLGDDISEDEETTMNAVKDAFTAEALTGQTWYQLSNRTGVSEEVAKEMALLSAQQIDAFAVIQKMTDEGRAGRVGASYRMSAEYLQNAVELRLDYDDYTVFANTDIGHGFKSFTDYQFLGLMGVGGYGNREFAAPKKNGQSAVILEDDDQQRIRWKELINTRTQFQSSDADLYTAPESVLDRQDDPTTGLFLLDIQNGADEFAGVRIGEALLRYKLSEWKASGYSSDFPEVTIRIWSTSPEHVRMADEHFKKLIGEHNSSDSLDYAIEDASKISFSFAVGGSRSNGASPITLDIRDKLWNVYDLSARTDE